MADPFRIGTSALLAMQQALTTTGHNIANVSTEGYNRQRIDFATTAPQATGAGYLGTGVEVTSIRRSYSEFLDSQVRSLASSVRRHETFQSLTTRVDDLLSDSEYNLDMALQKFFNKLQDVVNNPSAIPERQALLGEASNLVNQQTSLSSMLDQMEQNTNAGIESVVRDINQLAESIAAVNDQIIASGMSNEQLLPNDLLDQRDLLVNQLAEKVAIRINNQDDGSVNIFIGQGQALVLRGSVSVLRAVTNPFDSARTEIGLVGLAGTKNITSQMTGGEIQGFIEFRERVLDPARNRLGLITLGLTETFNAQHALGIDLQGNLGGDFFEVDALQAVGHTNNAGTAAPVVTLADVGAVRPSDYLLRYDGSQWELSRESDGTSVAGAGPLTLDGLSVDVSAGTATAGDRFRIRMAQAGNGFGVSVRNAEEIAAAAPVSASVPLTNAGVVRLSGLTATDASELPLVSDITLTFNPDAMGAGVPGFDVAGFAGASPFAYDPATESGGKLVSLGIAGISFEVSGTPQSGDQALVKPGSGRGDNRNAVLLGALQQQPLLDGAASTLHDVYTGLLSQVGVATQQAEANVSVDTNMLRQAESARSSISGVNLDEEAANLLRLQQAFQAAAKFISTTDTMMQTLLSITG